MSESGCNGKLRHTYAEAEREAKRLRRRFHTPLETYRCARCRGWHVGGSRP